MTPLPDNSTRSLCIAMLPFSFFHSSPTKLISLFSQDSFRTSLPPISPLCHHLPALQTKLLPEAPAWPSPSIPCNLQCPPPASAFCRRIRFCNKAEIHSVGPSGLILQPGAYVLCFLRPLPVASFHHRPCSGTFKGSVSSLTFSFNLMEMFFLLSLPVEFLASFQTQVKCYFSRKISGTCPAKVRTDWSHPASWIGTFQRESSKSDESLPTSREQHISCPGGSRNICPSDWITIYDMWLQN